MTKIIVCGRTILAVNPVDTGEAWATPDLVIPKHVAPNASVVEAILPDDFSPATYEWSGAQLVPVALSPIANAELTSAKAALALQVDERVAEVYSRWFRFDAEYTAREAAARAFAAAGFAGEPDVWVSAFAFAAGKTFQSAAELIIAQADMLRSALLQLGALRMQKYRVLGAPDLGSARYEQRQILDQINGIAEGL